VWLRWADERHGRGTHLSHRDVDDCGRDRQVTADQSGRSTDAPLA
jgi:hypothetical protein